MPVEMKSPSLMPRFYRIKVAGKIDGSWSDWLGGMRLIARKEANGMQTTTLCGVLTDQAALRGILNRLWDLNLVLLSVQQVSPSKNQRQTKENF